jgi:hypothetical protein
VSTDTPPISVEETATGSRAVKPRDHRFDQSLCRPPAPRIVPGELVAARIEPAPSRRVWGRLVPRAPEVAWGQLAWGRIALRAVGLLAAVAVAAGLVWLAVQAVLSLIATVVALVAFVAAWVQAHLLFIVLGGALLLYLLIRIWFGSSCAGLHCGGCRR